MFKLTVTANKLNIRNSPKADPSYANWIGDMNKGEEFVATDIIRGEDYESIPYWYKDNYNRYASLTGLDDSNSAIPWSLRVLGIPHVWTETKGEGIRVAIIDSGIDLNNKDLANAVLAAERFNVLDGTNNVQDIFSLSHGSFCSSIIASRGQNGLLGVAPLCELIIIKIADKFEDYFNETNQLKGLQQALSFKPDVISMSFGMRFQNPLIRSTVNNAMQAGVICIAATGDHFNEPNVEYPANYKGMIAVGSVACNNSSSANFNEGLFVQSRNSTGGLANDQQEGVTIVAPGDDVSGYDNAGNIQKGIGTSFAAPYIAGVAALWLALMRKKQKSFSNNHFAFKSSIISNSVKNFSGYNPKFSGEGLINPISLLSI